MQPPKSASQFSLMEELCTYRGALSIEVNGMPAHIGDFLHVRVGRAFNIEDLVF